MLLLAILAGIGALCLVFLFYARFRSGALPAMILPFMVVFFLSRFDVKLRWALDGRPVLGIHSLLILAAILMAVLHGTVSRKPLPGTMRVVLGAAGFVLVTLVSGAVNGGGDGLLAALHVLLIVLPPMAAAFAYVSLWPRQLGGVDALGNIYLMYVGVLTPLIILATSFFPDVLGAKLGWKPAVDEFDAGFVRGWSPLGSAIGTGCLVALAYALALHKALMQKNRLYLAVALLSGISLAFTLSRSVMLLMFVFHALYWWWYARPYRRRSVILWPGLMAVAFVVFATVFWGMSFARFIETRDFSLNIRESSAQVAWKQSLDRPVLGHGPGRVYEEIRTTWLFDPVGEEKRKITMLDGVMTAQEPHNLYLWIAVEHGYAALVFFLLVLTSPWTTVRRKVGGDETRDSYRGMVLAAQCGVLIFFLTNSGPLSDPQFSFFFWMWMFTPLAFAAEHGGGHG